MEQHISKQAARLKTPFFARERNRLFSSLFFVAALLCLTFYLLPLRYETNDENFLMYILAGYVTGRPEGFNVFTSGLFGYPVAWLYKLIPSVPWYPVVLLVCLFVTNFAILKSFLKMATTRDVHWSGGLGCYLFLFLTCLLFYIYRLQHTTVAGYAGAAACAIFLSRSSGDSRTTRISDIVLFGFLIYIALSLRVQVGYIVSAFLGLLLLREAISCFKHRSRKKRTSLLLYGGVFVVIMASAFSFQSLYRNANPTWEPYFEFNTQRVLYLDYASPDYWEAPELYDSIGWSYTMEKAVQDEWYLIDKRITTETLATINQYKQQNWNVYESGGFNSHAQYAAGLIKAVSFSGTKIGYAIAALMCISLLSAGILFSKRKITDALWALGIPFTLLCVLVFMAFRGRFISRLEFAITAPAAVIILLYFLSAWGQRRRETKPIVRTLFACVCLLASLWAVFPALQRSSVDILPGVWADPGEAQSAKMAAEQYAVAHPDNFYIYDISLSMPTTVFALYPDLDAIPDNMMLYGGTTSNSPLYYRQLENQGFSQFHSEQLLEDGVYFMSFRIAREDYMPLVDLMKEDYGANVELVDTVGNVKVYRFVRVT